MMFNKQLVTVVFILCAFQAFAQVKISGVVYNEYLEPFYNAKITSSSEIITSNTDGEFTITVSKDLPQTITISAFGHQTEYVEIVEEGQNLNVILKESLLLDQIVISASRVPERIIESPVTIERFGADDIRRTASSSFYDGLTNLKGIDSREVSYGFKSINSRGFADFTNTRFVQLVDGMDSAAQALSYSTGNFSGVSELDILSVEILPGASSALYGANSYNGIMLMNTKNPFDYTGITTMFKSGFTSQDEAGNNPFADVAIRMGYKFNDKFAAKVNASYFEVKEWSAADYRNKEVDTNELIDGGMASTPQYDGVNVYGDENFYSLAFTDYLGLNLPRSLLSRRQGYTERQLIGGDFTSKNVRFSGSLHYRPFSDESLELQLTSRLSLRDNLFQGNDTRLVQKNYYIGQHRLEVKGDNFYIRGYLTANDSGNSFDLTKTADNILNDAGVFYDSYAFDFYQKFYDEGTSIQDARNFAFRNAYVPGSPEFIRALGQSSSTLITKGGSAIFERSNYIHTDGNYNFKSLLNDWADFQVGGSYRKYNPNSKGTLFNDGQEKINLYEYGFYTQLQKNMLNDRLKFTGSIRYDKSQNFDANYSPRVAINYSLGEDKNHVLRASYQTGFRNPTLQEQYLFSQSGVKTNLGTIRENLDRVSYEDVRFYGFDASTGWVENFRTINGSEVLDNALLTKAYYTDDIADRQYIKSDYKSVVPEVVKTIELGYRGILRLNNSTNLYLDFNGFYSRHNDFIFIQDIVIPNAGKVFPNGNTRLTDQEIADLTNPATSPTDFLSNVQDNIVVLDQAAAISFNDAIFNGVRVPNLQFVSGVSEFNIVTNAKSIIDSYGFGLDMHTKLFRNFDLGLNYNFIDFEYEDKDNGFFEPNFNSPKHTVKVQFGNEKLIKNFGFNIDARWQDKYRWVSTFVKGEVDARTVIDAQLNYTIPSIKSRIKVGGTNLFGKDYYVAPGAGQIGQLYYISWVINQ